MSILVRKYQVGNKIAVKPDTTINDGMVKEIPKGWNKGTEEVVNGKNRTWFETQNNEPKTTITPPVKKITPASTATVDPIAYDKIIRNRLAKGEKLQDLVNSGVVSLETAKKYIIPFEVKRKVYTESDIPVNKVATVTNNITEPAGMIQDRKEIFSGNKYQSFNYPDAHAGYSQATQVHFDPTTKKEIDPLKSFTDGRYTPHFVEGGRDYYANTKKFDIPGTNSTKENLQINNAAVKGQSFTTSFRNGGVMKSKTQKCMCGCALYKTKKK